MSKFFKKSSKKGNGNKLGAVPETRSVPAGSRASLPGAGFGFADLTSYEKDVKESDLDVALKSHFEEAYEMAEKLKKRADRTDAEEHPTADLENMLMQTYGLKGCFFIGHTNTDMDSVASAIGAAELFEGTATRSEREVNGEIEFACKYAGFELPKYFDDCDGANDANNTEQGICLVDHNEPGQMIASLGTVAFPGKGASKSELETATKMVARIKGIIDHHAMSQDFATGHPLFIDIRPWGSACSIVAHIYVRLGRPIPKKVAIVLLCGILSDTINLTSPTTTHADKVFATLLTFLGGEKHPNRLAEEMFKAKTAHLVNLSPYSIVRADQKNFQMGEYLVGWATIEVNEPLAILAKSRKLLFELRVLKKEKNLDFVFLSVVDLQKKKSVLLLCGELEVIIAKEVFKGKTSNALDYVNDEADEPSSCKHHGHSHSHSNTQDDLEAVTEAIHLNPTESLMDIGNKVSRKKEFVPPLKNFLASGWKPSRQSVRIAKDERAPSVKTEHLCVEGVGCSIQRTFSIDENAQSGDH